MHIRHNGSRTNTPIGALDELIEEDQEAALSV
jgi:hypothetical protein